jgi:3-hydroxybutyryl-CoA dehydrogenase
LSTTVAIIGAGPLGRWLALAAARAGFRVLLEDVMPNNLHHAQEYLRQELSPALLRQESGPHAADAQALAAVAFVSTIEDAVHEADLVVDCVPDELESKLEILWLLDRMAPPRTVFATPTTRLSIADLANCTYRPEKCIAIAAEASSLTGNPAGISSAEPPSGSGAKILLRTTSRTAPESAALVRDFWQRLGFQPTFESDSAEQA